MNNLKYLLLLFLFIACEFRPPGYYINYQQDSTRCIYPVPSVGEYDLDESLITVCKYNSNQEVKQEIIYDANIFNQVGLVTYSYKKTYYIKTIYNYEIGSPEYNYVIDRYYVNR